MADEKRYSIGEVAEAAGVSRRTVRYYVQRGLLPPPLGLGRGDHYTGDHLAVILQVKSLQERGFPLEEILLSMRGFQPPEPPLAQECDTGDEPTRPPERPEWAPGEAWVRQVILPDYELHARAGARPLTATELAALARAIKEIIRKGDER
jgi:DNA-binding transcriptional MerR regulator